MCAMTTSPSALTVETLPFRGSPLAQAMRSGTLPAELGSGALRGADAIEARARALLDSFSSDDRRVLNAWLPAATRLESAAAPASARLREAIDRGLVVTTGQQPGLLGGPLYTWHKALSAIALADELSNRLGVPVAPLFWAATDDADFAEGATTWFPTATGSDRVRWPLPAMSGSTPVSAVPLPDMTEAFAAFDRACGSGADASIRRAVRDAYDASHSVGDAYVALMRALLEPRGMAVLDASHLSVRAAGHDVAMRALSCADEIDRALQQRTAALSAAGFAPQVELVQGLSLVFRWDGISKTRVPISDTKQAMAAPRGAFSGNVLLRPVIEAALLPTVTYVAGPGELSYFAQVDVVARAIDSRAPRAVARWSARIIESRVADAAQLLGAPLDAFADREALLHAVASAEMPPALRAAMNDLRASVQHSIARIADEARAIDLPTSVATGGEQQLLHRVERFERRLVARAAAHDVVRRARVALVAGAIFPGGAPQERALNALPLLARYGDAMWDAWADGARRWASTLFAAPSVS
jgi:bacillithiol synthase